MMHRYLLLRYGSEGAGALAPRRIAAPSGFREIPIAPGLIAFVASDCRCLTLSGMRGIVIGDLFHRHGASGPIQALGERDEAAIVRDPQQLNSRYWGGYVAVVVNDGCTRIIRDPTGALPCYHVELGQIEVFASDIITLCEAGVIKPEIDWHGLASYLYTAGLPTRTTAIAGVRELLPATAMQFEPGRASIIATWSPWKFTAIEPVADWEDRAIRLRRVVESCVRAWASSFDRILLSLSGGLDSSIVAASLAGSHSETVALTMYSDDAAGDERFYARELCTVLGIELRERLHHVKDIDIDQAAGPHLPRPIGRTQNIAYERAFIATSASVGSQAFFTGNGGDNVFSYSQSATSILDRYLFEGVSFGVLQTLGDVQALTGCGPVEALRAAVRVARKSKRAYHWRPDDKFLHPDLVSYQSRQALDHSWLTHPPDGLPGQSAHIAGLLRVQQNLLPMRSAHAPVINPLLSQPIVEECLSIPSWIWCAGGKNRSLARIAFRDKLPPLIINRKTKGTPDSFCIQILETYKDSICDRLLNGRLARHGLVDRERLERSLRSDRLALGIDHVRLLDLLDTEAWISHWENFTASDDHRRHVLTARV